MENKMKNKTLVLDQIALNQDNIQEGLLVIAKDHPEDGQYHMHKIDEFWYAVSKDNILHLGVGPSNYHKFILV
jgi:hypothetical protein